MGDWEPFQVNNSVSAVMQHDNTSCWAAGIAMIVGSDLDTVLAGPPNYRDSRMPWASILRVANAWGLSQIYPQCGMPDLWNTTLSNHGAVWIVLRIDDRFDHAVVLHSIASDGTLEGTTMYYNDPMIGSTQALYSEFENMFELGARANANIFAR